LTQREAGRQGSGVVIGRIAGDGVIAVRKIDDIQDRRGGRIALIGDDLVAGVIEIEARQRDDGTGGNRGGRRVGDRAFARPESAGGQPAVVGEINDGARLDVTREDERERVCGAAVVLNDGDVADRQKGSHQAASSISASGEPDAGTGAILRRLSPKTATATAKIVLSRRLIVSRFSL